jgi:hypothetical protein
MPARTKAQPLLSTYWVPVKELGGNSAGIAKPCAAAPVIPTPAAIVAAKAIALAKLVADIVTPTRYCGKIANNAQQVKALSP